MPETVPAISTLVLRILDATWWMKEGIILVSELIATVLTHIDRAHEAIQCKIFNRAHEAVQWNVFNSYGGTCWTPSPSEERVLKEVGSRCVHGWPV